MKNLKVKIKKLHKDAVIPSYAHSTDCGLDLTAVSKTYDEYGNVVYGFGLAFEIPEGYAGFIFPRSSNHKSGLLLTNSVGVIDSGFRGEVTAKFAANDKMIRPRKFIDKLKMLFIYKRNIVCEIRNITNRFYFIAFFNSFVCCTSAIFATTPTTFYNIHKHHL